MAERIVLHIGVQKSGTTYLQQMMQDRVRELADIGVLYPLPGGRTLKHDRLNHHELATYGLLGTEYPWVGEERSNRLRGWWEQLRERVREWPGTAVISAEALSVVRSDAARQTVEALGSPDNTDVVITARSLGKQLPSAWQQHLRNGRAMRYEAFLERAERQRGMGWDVLEKEPQTQRWRAFAFGRLAERWAAIVGAEHVTLITNPGSPADLLWQRFLEAVELPGASHLPEPDTSTVHGGVTAAEAMVLDSLNANLASHGWSSRAIKSLDKKIIQDFGARKERGPRLGIIPTFREQVDQWSREDIADLRQTGVRIVGDLDELGYSTSSEPPEPTPHDVARAAGVAARTVVDVSAAT